MDFLSFLQEYYIYVIIGIFVIFIFALIIKANFSYDSYVKQYKKMKNVFTSFHGSSLDMANFLNAKRFLNMLNIEVFEKTPDKSNGSYAPFSKTLSLSSEIAFDNSIAGIAITVHEFGHALQHFENSKKLVNNFSLMRFVKVLGAINYPVFFIAIAFFITNLIIPLIICLLFIGFSFLIAVVLKYLTLNLEKDASERAVNLLKKFELISEQEILLVKKFLKSAQKTYTGDFIRAVFAWTGLTRKTKFF